MTSEITDNRDAGRYELALDGQIAFALYRRDGANVAIRHVETPQNLRGTGVAGRLMEAIMARARAEGFTVTPLCSYAGSWLRRHPEHRDLVR
jgi:predicted GNAT family acetyltransferase